MEKYVLSKKDLQGFIGEISNKNRVYAPVKNNGMTFFKEIKKPSEVNLDFKNTNFPPKGLMFQQTETMFRFKPGPKGKIESIDMNDKQTVIFGIRPCDAKSLSILDHAFSGDFEDPYFLNRRENTTLVGLSCIKPFTNCFCTSFDDSPASSENVDILLTDIGDNYFVEVSTEKGRKLAKGASKLLKKATDSDAKKMMDSAYIDFYEKLEEMYRYG